MSSLISNKLSYRNFFVYKGGIVISMYQIEATSRHYVSLMLLSAILAKMKCTCILLLVLAFLVVISSTGEKVRQYPPVTLNLLCII